MKNFTLKSNLNAKSIDPCRSRHHWHYFLLGATEIVDKRIQVEHKDWMIDSCHSGTYSCKFCNSTKPQVEVEIEYHLGRGDVPELHNALIDKHSDYLHNNVLHNRLHSLSSASLFDSEWEPVALSRTRHDCSRRRQRRKRRKRKRRRRRNRSPSLTQRKNMEWESCLVQSSSHAEVVFIPHSITSLQS